jgi:hypothetical protein
MRRTPQHRGGELRYPESGRRKGEGPGTFLERTPGLLHARVHQGKSALPLCLRYVALSSAACGAYEGKRGDLSALQLQALRRAGAHLPCLRPGQPVLREAVRADAPARVIAACWATLPAKSPRSVSARCAPEGLARAPDAESDASGFPSPRCAGHSGGELDPEHAPGGP